MQIESADEEPEGQIEHGEGRQTEGQDQPGDQRRDPRRPVLVVGHADADADGKQQRDMVDQRTPAFTRNIPMTGPAPLISPPCMEAGHSR